MENLARYIIRASFSQERMQQHLDQEEKVVYTAKDKKTSKVFAALEWLAKLCSHIPCRGEQMVQHHGFGITVRDFSTIGNPHFDSISKVKDL